jgi:hypothetical protein
MVMHFTATSSSWMNLVERFSLMLALLIGVLVFSLVPVW